MTADEHRCAEDPETIALDVALLSHGPDALARHEGRVVFVPGVAPGDRVRARIVEEHGSYVRAQVTHRCAPGPAYRVPPCPWVAECGGCPWQQVAYPAQLEAKARNVRELLARIAHGVAARELPILAAPSEWAYRHRIRLHVGPDGAFGYMQPRSHRIVEIDDCAVAHPLLASVIVPLRRALATLATRLDGVELIASGRGGVIVRATARDRYREEDSGGVARLMRELPSLAGVQLCGRGWQRTWGDPAIALSPDPALPPITQRPGTFTQVNPEANRLLVRVVVGIAPPAEHVLDLFCGAGNLSLPLAHAGARVLGIDRDRTAIADATANAAAAGLRFVRFDVAAAEHFLRQQGTAGADLVVLDPPRAGARAAVTQLARLKPPRILYVSCDPATLARDVAVLVSAGYAIDRVQPIDFFPQTHHVETVLEAVRR